MEEVIVTGCTLSELLFAVAMTWLVLSVGKETKWPNLSLDHYQLNSTLFMDDIVTTTETIVQKRIPIKKLTERLDLAGFTANPEKCRIKVK